MRKTLSRCGIGCLIYVATLSVASGQERVVKIHGPEINIFEPNIRSTTLQATYGNIMPSFLKYKNDGLSPDNDGAKLYLDEHSFMVYTTAQVYRKDETRSAQEIDKIADDLRKEAEARDELDARTGRRIDQVHAKINDKVIAAIQALPKTLVDDGLAERVSNRVTETLRPELAKMVADMKAEILAEIKPQP